MQIIDRISLESNVRIRGYVDDVLVIERESHNIMTNIGRTWLRDLVGAKSYSNVAAATGYIEGSGYVRTSERARFIGFGVGGVLTSDASIYLGTQDEVVTVTSIEDYVKVDAANYLKEALPQDGTNSALPDDYSIKLIVQIPESEISFAGNTSKSGGLAAPGTSVPISEVGLYISGADKTQTPEHADNVGRMVAYNVFDPINVSPNITLQVEWELRF